MKWNLINLDLVPSFDKFSAEEEGKGFFFCSQPQSLPTIPPPFSRLKREAGCMVSDKAATPVE